MTGRIAVRASGLLLASLIVGVLLGAGAGDGWVFRVADRSLTTLDGMARELGGARAVFIGEVHSEADHHRVQLDVLRALHRAGVPMVIGLEMFRAGQQAELDRWTEGVLGEPQFRAVYERNWTLPWELYRDIFLFAREKRIPLLGINVPDDVISKVAREGFASLTGKDLQRLPKGISCSVDERYREFIRRSHGVRGHSGRSFEHFCEAQMVWDAVMAQHVADRLEIEPVRAVVVLSGSGHAWRRGIPAQLRRLAPDVRSAVVMPLIEGRIGRSSVTGDDADFVVL